MPKHPLRWPNTTNRGVQRIGSKLLFSGGLKTVFSGYRWTIQSVSSLCSEAKCPPTVDIASYVSLVRVSMSPRRESHPGDVMVGRPARRCDKISM